MPIFLISATSARENTPLSDLEDLKPFTINNTAEAFGYAVEAVKNGAELLICNEIMNTLIFGLLKKEKIFDLMDMCRGKPNWS